MTLEIFNFFFYHYFQKLKENLSGGLDPYFVIIQVGLSRLWTPVFRGIINLLAVPSEVLDAIRNLPFIERK